MSANMNRVVLTYGTFDLFHAGHVELLARARQLGSRLVVGLSTDEFNAEKGKKSVFAYEDRKKILVSCRYVDDVFPEINWDQKISDAIRLHAHVFVMGDDWSGKFDFMKNVTGVVYLPRTPEISSSGIKQFLGNRHATMSSEYELQA